MPVCSVVLPLREQNETPLEVTVPEKSKSNPTTACKVTEKEATERQHELVRDSLRLLEPEAAEEAERLQHRLPHLLSWLLSSFPFLGCPSSPEVQGGLDGWMSAL